MGKAAAVEVVPGVWRIPTAPRDFINSYAFVDDDGSVTLVDTGVKRAPKRIVAALATMGKHPRDVQRIVLTHVHPDHAGGAAQLSRETGAEVLVHGGDHPSAEAGTILAKADPRYLSGRLFSRLPAPKFDPFTPGLPLHDGQVLPVAGGLRVLHTPGHSDGHVSLLHEPTGVLVTGDAMMNLRRIRISPRFLCSDFALTRKTVHRLGELEYDVAAFTHGPHIVDGARERVRRFLLDLLAEDGYLPDE